MFIFTELGHSHPFNHTPLPKPHFPYFKSFQPIGCAQIDWQAQYADDLLQSEVCVHEIILKDCVLTYQRSHTQTTESDVNFS